MNFCRYEHIDHTADVGIRVFGRSLEELYENAAWAYFDLITDVKKIEPKKTRVFEIEGETPEEMLRNVLVTMVLATQVDWELYAEFSSQRLSFPSLELEAKGEEIDEEKHIITLEIKAVTYHGLRVWQEGKLWVGEVIFDI